MEYSPFDKDRLIAESALRQFFSKAPMPDDLVLMESRDREVKITAGMLWALSDRKSFNPKASTYPLSDFDENQWWFKELTTVAERRDVPDDLRRAVAVVRALLNSIRASEQSWLLPCQHVFVINKEGHHECTRCGRYFESAIPLAPYPSIQDPWQNGKE